LLDVVDNVIDQAIERPWTSEQVPPLTEWIAANREPLDLLVEASKRPRCYSPSPSLVDGSADMILLALLPQISAVREVARSLSARATWNMGHGRYEEAWSDVLAIHRWARLVGQDGSMIAALMAVAIDETACDLSVTLLDQKDLPSQLARQVLSDLAALPAHAAIARSVDQLERLWFADAISHLGTYGAGTLLTEITGQADATNRYVNSLSIDWNVVLRDGNQWYDRLAAAAKLPTRAERRQALPQVAADFRQAESEATHPLSYVSAAFSREQRSEIMGTHLMALFLPAAEAASNAEDRANNALQLTRLAAGLAVYRGEHGEYPERLVDLVPGVLGELPVDIYNAKPFLYRRDSDGYLLYCAGDNGQDDGGSHARQRVFEGCSPDEMSEAQSQRAWNEMPPYADDWSIRVPRPAFELPRLPSAAGADQDSP